MIRLIGTLLICCGLLGAFQVADTAKKDKCAVEGRVVNAAGQPLSKVSLLLALAPAAFGSKGLPAETGADGHFVFEDLNPGSYVLTGQRAGYGRQSYGARKNASSGTPLTLTAGKDVRDLTFTMSQPSAISGRVLDEDGEPMPRILVSVFADGYTGGKRQYEFRPGAYSGADGAYRMEGYPAGHYLVAAGNVGDFGQNPLAGPGQAYPFTYYPHATRLATAVQVVVRPGMEVTGIDIKMLKVAAVRVKGKVVGVPQGTKASVGFGTRDMPCHPALQQVVQVSLDGSFEYPNVAPGSYWLALYSVGTRPNFTMPIEVKDEPIEDVVLPYSPLIEVRGRLLTDKTPAKGLTVTGDPDGFNVATAPVAEDGSFTLKGQRRGSYAITVTGLGESYVKSVKYAGRDVTEAGADIGGGTEDTLEIALSAAGAQVYGVVRDGDDKPVPGATVALIPDSRRHPLFRTATSDQNGAFSIRGIVPGDYKALAWEDIESGAYEDPEVLKPIESKAEALSLKEGEQKAIRLRAIPET